ncbi:two-component system response regulator [Rhizomicrobium sp. SCGC AG-212-E05]|nr:two-component system response regulator [Rhizomicrobium sp. SCGC AG-212-E05]
MQGLLIDDDAELCCMMQEFFTQCGHSLETARDGRTGLKRALEEPYDIVLLDVMLPVIDGFSVLQQIRRSKSLPIIMLTARTHRDDRIAGLNRGADDYLVKPFDPEELLARVDAVLRRTNVSACREPVRQFNAIEISVPAREVRLAGQIVELTGLEFDIFELLTRQPGRTVPRDEITRALLGRAASPYDRALDVHVSHLRDKLKGRSMIRTVRGVGYVFAAEVQT